MPADLVVHPDESYFEFYRLNGSDLEIDCHLNDYRPYEIAWYKGDDPVSSDTRLTVHQILRTPDEASLIVKDSAGFSDSGNYSCVATWDVHNDPVEIELDVKGLLISVNLFYFEACIVVDRRSIEIDFPMSIVHFRTFIFQFTRSEIYRGWDTVNLPIHDPY